MHTRNDAIKQTPMPCGWYFSRYAKLLELLTPLHKTSLWRESGPREVFMARKSWSNLFLFLAAVNLVFGLLPGNPVKLVDWIGVPFCLVLGTFARRRMV